MAEICVVHLVWAPLGPAPLERFARSYRHHEAGADHRLLMVFKQFNEPGQRAEAEQALSGLEYESLEMPRRKLDLAAYVAIARQVESPAFYFLNSNSELLAEGWLGKPWRHLRRAGVGIVGATGSYESLLPPSGALRFLRSAWFDPFPNPHVRTNAFLMRREVMLSLHWGEVVTKSGAWRLENGKRSVTQQVWEEGLEALVVGRDGEAYDHERWYESHTFRSGGQRNLLVADNRTRQFAEADPAEQRRLAELAWGDRAEVGS
jgi:hypothetical protein